MIHVIATISVAPGSRAAFLTEFGKLVPLVRAESGCLEYGAAIDEPTGLAVQSLAGENAVIVVEKWASVDALNAHLKAPHMADYRVRVKDLVQSVSLRVLRPV
jgi:quinol monooxygenase YgiN